MERRRGGVGGAATPLCSSSTTPVVCSSAASVEDERGEGRGQWWGVGAWVRAGEGSAVVGVGDEGMRREEEKEVGGLL